MQHDVNALGTTSLMEPIWPRGHRSGTPSAVAGNPHQVEQARLAEEGRGKGYKKCGDTLWAAPN